LSAVGSLQKAAVAEGGLAGIAGFLSEGLGTLAAQFLQTRTDRRKVVGSAWFGHVPSFTTWPSLDEARMASQLGSVVPMKTARPESPAGTPRRKRKQDTWQPEAPIQ
jgi:hypothetical protein